MRLKKQEARLKDFCKQTDLYYDSSRLQVFTQETENGIRNFGKSVSSKAAWANRKGIDKSINSSIIKEKRISTDGLRNEEPLTAKQIEENTKYAVRLGMPEEQIRYGEHYFTAYGSEFDMLYIGTDVYPSNINRKKANSRVSNKGAIAHEIVGHREAVLKGWAQEDEVLDEIQASIRAARFAPELTTRERFVLLRDAAERAQKNGISLKCVKDKLNIKER